MSPSSRSTMVPSGVDSMATLPPRMVMAANGVVYSIELPEISWFVQIPIAP